MLDVRYIRENPEHVIENVKFRNIAGLNVEKTVKELLAADGKWRELKQKVDDLRHRRNKVSEEINAAKKAGKIINALVKEASEIPKKLAAAEKEMNDAEAIVISRLRLLPNILQKDVPVGKSAEDNVELKRFGKPKKFSFELKPHGELAEELNIADWKRGAKVAGAGFYYLKGKLALLDHSLQRFGIDYMVKKGFALVEPPFMVRRHVAEGATTMADAEKQMYHDANEDLFLIPTAEFPLVGMHADETLAEKDLPVKLCGFSPCFRKELGSHGIDTRGLFRVHQFNKIEQVVYCKPEDSEHWFNELLKITEGIMKELELPYRIVFVCSNDAVLKAARQYDIEAWFPRQGKYAEIGSLSNCTDFQSRTLNTKYISKEGPRFVHMLNNTALATSRIMVAILENFQNKDGTISIPKALWRYTGFKKIEKEK